ncbi:MAG TPA: hypothetical protein VG890_03390 [Puia sp.]|nr:hypothetical protein [Puia sp.]
MYFPLQRYKWSEQRLDSRAFASTPYLNHKQMLQSKIFAILALAAISLCGCGDCLQVAKAKILDITTKEPIDSVKVSKMNRPEQNTLTDTRGFFELRSISGGLGGCPLMTVIINKKGYQIKTVEIDSDSLSIIYLDKE